MKRLVTFALLCAFSTILMAAGEENNVVKNVVFTLGKTYLINPIADCGYGPFINKWYYQHASSDNSNLYSISDGEAFNITTIKNANGSDDFGNAVYYYTFQMTPLETGTYTFYENITYSQDTYNLFYGSVTYNITVVDLTNIFMPPTLALQVGDTYTFTPTFVNSQAENTIIWQSTNTAVATIDDHGNLSANGTGATIVRCIADNGVSAQCEVTVNPVSVSNITLNKTEAELTVGGKLQLSAAVSPNNASNKTVTWSCSNQAVALVNESGLVYAAGPGICQIKATANDGSGKTASCLVTVTNSTPAPSLQGDMNGDGILSVTDVLLLINLILQQ